MDLDAEATFSLNSKRRKQERLRLWCTIEYLRLIANLWVFFFDKLEFDFNRLQIHLVD